MGQLLLPSMGCAFGAAGGTLKRSTSAFPVSWDRFPKRRAICLKTGVDDRKPPALVRAGGATEGGRSPGCRGKIAALARRRVAEQNSAEPGQVAGLGQVPDCAFAGFLEHRPTFSSPNSAG